MPRWSLLNVALIKVTYLKSKYCRYWEMLLYEDLGLFKDDRSPAEAIWDWGRVYSPYLSNSEATPNGSPTLQGG